jgi:hypothetical protein
MLTALTYSALVIMAALAMLRDKGWASTTLVACFALSAWLGPKIKAQPDHDAVMIILDLAVVYGMRLWCSGPRAYAIGVIGLSAIVLRTMHIGGLDIGKFSYALAINGALAIQLLIAGGFADGVGRWLGGGVNRVMPRVAGLFRHVAGA